MKDLIAAINVGGKVKFGWDLREQIEKASNSLFTSIFFDMVVVLVFACILTVALDYSLGTTSGQGAEGIFDKNRGSPASPAFC